MVAFDVLVTGNVSVDVIFPEIENVPQPGEELYCDDFAFTCGASYNAAVALARLGMKVAIAAPIGNDFLSHFILNKLESEGVNTEYMHRLDQPLRTLSVALNYGGDRSFISYEDSIHNFSFESYVRSVIERVDAKVIHTEARPEAVSIIEVAKRKAIKVSLDVGWNESWLQDSQLKDIIRMGDFFTPNMKEAKVITKEDNTERAVEELQRLNPENNIIVKVGSKGALIREEDKVILIPAEGKTPVDTTGAGDVFIAGVIAAILKGFSFPEAIRIGNFCGACSVEGLGGAEHSPTWDRVTRELLENNK
ncbi:carbohydrate kinase family protein [Halobacillus sp. BBL2006]|uniref:carbohydrate kinase family protein n=1 Tax=Halobacillus sp. BBL2006 TaxID=1543706 RepID=UPI0005419FF9|nr:carbohydrate kinase family protein [Halobacillus sp. BBL2006]KHE71837.1 hypothetical protein LD39_07680 [Halobacillus sp. BBL2006]